MIFLFCSNEIRNGSRKIRLNCRGEIITLPKDVAERFFPVIKSAKNFDFTSGEYFVNHRASHVHDLLDSLEIPLRHELGIFEEKKVYTVDDVLISEWHESNSNGNRNIMSSCDVHIIDNMCSSQFTIIKYVMSFGDNYITQLRLNAFKDAVYPSHFDNIISRINSDRGIIIYSTEGHEPYIDKNILKEAIVKNIML